MNTLQPKCLDFQDFWTIHAPRSGLMSNILNTLRKLHGEGSTQRAEKLGQRRAADENPPAAMSAKREEALLPSHYNHREAPRNHRSPWVRTLGRRSRLRPHLSGHDINPASPAIERHRPPALLSLQRLHHIERVALRIHHRQRSILTVGTERQLVLSIEPSSIRPLANLHQLDHFARVGVRHRHLLTIAHAEQPPVLPIHRQPARRLAARQRPLSSLLKSLGIQPRN